MAYFPNLPAGQAKMDNSAPVVIAADQSPIAINVSTDAFEQLVVGSRYNQIEVNYSITDPDLVSEITITKTNGGDATNGSGVGVFSTGANTSGGIKAVTNNVVVYSPHFETYAAFSAIFTTGIANSYQRIGIYNDNNGFFLGYNNTIFGVTLRKGGVDSFVGQSSFNGDPLDGSANSKFYRDGLPEAVDFTKDNLYRIRFGWLGAAPITFEMLSPDCDWIAFHSIKFPNTATSASINDPSLPVTLDVQKSSAGATVLSIASGCWGAGTTSDLQKLSANITDSTLIRVERAVIAAKTPGGSYTNIQATASNNLRTAIAEVDAGAVFPINDNGGSITVDGNVTISGAVAVTDNNGSLTVDGTVAATQSGVWNINAISGTISLPTGAATAANQATEITALQLLDDVVATDGSAALTKLYQVGGTDGTNAQIISTNTTGHVNIADGGNSITVDGTVAATQSGTWNITNISGTVSLPTGAATAANQSTVITAVQLLDDVVATDGAAAVTKLYQVGGTDGTNAQILSVNTSGHVNIADGGNAITVDGTVAATQSGAWNVTNITGTVSLPTGAATETTLSGLNTKVPTGLTVASTRLLVDGSGVTQPVSGTVTIQDGAGSITVDGSVSVSNFPATQAVSATNLDIRDLTATDVVTITGGAGQTADVKVTLDAEQVAISNFPATQTVSGTVTLDSATLTALETISIGNAAGASAVNIQDGGNSITVDGTVAATQSGTWNITNISGTVSLPTGAATAANQATEITALQLLDNVVNTAGTAAVTSLYQVGGTDGTSARILGLNASGHVKIEDGGNSITVDGTVAATQSGTWSTRTQDGAGNALTSHLAGSSRGIDVSILDGAGNQITSFGGGTQYTEGDIDASITGTAMLWEDTSDTLRAVSSAKPLPVNIVAGAASGTEYADGTTVATPTGAAVLGWDGTAVQVVRTDSTGVLAIQDNGSSITVDGTVAISNASIPVTDNGGSLTVDGSVSVSNFPATQPVSGTVEIGATSLAALETISVANFPATQPVSGTITANAGTGTFATSDANAVSQATATAAQKGYLSLAGATATLPTYTAGNTNAMTMTTSGLLRVDGSNVTQPVSGTITANAGSGTMNVSVQNASIPVTGTFFQATQPVSGTVSADTELPAAVTLAEALANPTTPLVGSAALGYNGATWDRIKSEGTAADGEPTSTTGNMGVCSHDEIFNGTTWDRMRSAAALDGTGATSHTGVLAVLQPNKRFNPANLGTAANSTSVLDVNGANTARLAIGTTTTGTFIVEVTADGTNWSSAEVYGTAGDSWFSGQNITPAAGSVYTILVGSWRALRIRTVTTLGATVAHFFTLSMSQGVITAIDTGAAPHAIGYSILNKSGEYTTAQTGVALWTPATGKKFVITDLTISTGGTTAGVVTVWQGASADTTYTVGTDAVLFRGEFAPSATAKPGMVKSLTVPFVSSTADHILRVTTSTAMTVYIQVNGYEII